MATEQPSSDGAPLLLPMWGLASAGAAVGFFGGYGLLPPDWWAAAVLAGVAGGATGAWWLVRRSRSRSRTSVESQHST